MSNRLKWGLTITLGILGTPVLGLVTWVVCTAIQDKAK